MKRILFFLVMVFFFSCEIEPEFDLLILNGTVYDGSLNEPQKIDIGIRGDFIVKVGELSGYQAVKSSKMGSKCA